MHEAVVLDLRARQHGAESVPTSLPPVPLKPTETIQQPAPTQPPEMKTAPTPPPETKTAPTPPPETKK